MTNLATTEQALDTDLSENSTFAIGESPATLSDIYKEGTNIAVWKRPVHSELESAVDDFLAANPNFEKSLVVTPDELAEELIKVSNSTAPKPLVQDIELLVEMFSCLFELKKVGVRLTSLDVAMCPRFHVDHVPCRLVSTYHGVATEWLAHTDVDRTKLGHGSKGLSDAESGLFLSPDCVNQLTTGDVALLKGESWLGNSEGGLVHRSPSVPNGQNRLLLTLDFYD
ncbi:hypothetical protein JCM19236_2614 [Vibrio sp. JCM 19236]|nr:hypothetical protein JCM19236_2614 [Vibrio sp. JCM 19236]